MNKFDARFNAVKTWYNDFVHKAIANNCTHFMYENDMIELDCLKLDASGLNIHYKQIGKFKYILNIFDSNVEYDNGMHTNIKEFHKEYLSKIKLFKEI